MILLLFLLFWHLWYISVEDACTDQPANSRIKRKAHKVKVNWCDNGASRIITHTLNVRCFRKLDSYEINEFTKYIISEEVVAVPFIYSFPPSSNNIDMLEPMNNISKLNCRSEGAIDVNVTIIHRVWCFIRNSYSNKYGNYLPPIRTPIWFVIN